MPEGIGVVDLMIGFPAADAQRHYDFLQPQLRDAGSADMQFPAEYMFKDVPNHLDEGADPVDVTLREMDRHGIAIGLVGLGGEASKRALKQHPDRFKASLEGDPNQITEAGPRIRRAHDAHGSKADSTLPARCKPQV